MLRRLHWLVLRRLPGPFFGWLGILMFLLLMQFLIRWLPEIAGKGIPVLVIVELIVYNLAYMVVLAVPMSVLLAALMAFGDLAESQYYTVIKSTGISFGEIVWPALVAALVVGSGLLYFNCYMLPEANYRATQLWSDIRNKRPGFELQPGTFYDGVEDYYLLVEDRPAGSNELIDVTIYDYTEGRDQQAVIKARRGHIQSKANGRRLTLVLYDGEMHRPRPPTSGNLNSRYETLRFDRHTMHFDLSDVVFSRSTSDGGGRTTRTTPLPGLFRKVDSMEADLRKSYESLYADARANLFPDTARTSPPPSSRPDSAQPSPPKPQRANQPYLATATLDSANLKGTALVGTRRARSLQNDIDNLERDANWQDERLRSYQVEIHKKFSMAVACLIFMIIGAPIGLALRRSGLGVAGAIALGIFIFYWVSLAQGEKLSERGFFPPWVGMWIANIFMSGVSLWLLLYVVLDLGATPPLRDRLWTWVTSDR